MKRMSAAFAALRETAKAGFVCSPKTLQRDPWLRPLRRHREFRLLVRSADNLVETAQASFETYIDQYTKMSRSRLCAKVFAAHRRVCCPDPGSSPQSQRLRFQHGGSFRWDKRPGTTRPSGCLFVKVDSARSSQSCCRTSECFDELSCLRRQRASL